MATESTLFARVSDPSNDAGMKTSPTPRGSKGASDNPVPMDEIVASISKMLGRTPTAVKKFIADGMRDQRKVLQKLARQKTRSP
jgi:hypothetical protein